MRSFRIIRNEYWNEYGQKINTYWTVQEKCKFLWWYYWQTVKYQADYDYTSVIDFDSQEAASRFITEVLIPKMPYSKFVDIIVDQIDISP
jgi:hypothetical protein